MLVLLQTIMKRQEHMIQELVNLQANIAALSASVDKLIAADSGKVSPADVQSAADQVKAIQAKVDVVVSPPAPAPAVPAAQ